LFISSGNQIKTYVTFQAQPRLVGKIRKYLMSICKLNAWNLDRSYAFRMKQTSYWSQVSTKLVTKH